MNFVTKHRGPDGEGCFICDDISFGHIRLAIQDLSKDGKQPMFYNKTIGVFYYDEEKEKFINNNNEKISLSIVKESYGIVFNGEVYNFKELRSNLIEKGYCFTTGTDTEVILASFIEYGNDCHKKFSGMWAFTIYDIKKKQLIFSRDRIGIKPLYYYTDKNNDIIYSSEIKGILEYSGYKKKVNDYMVYQYLVYEKDTHIKETFFKGIYKFPNASYGIYDIKTKQFNIKKYWDLTFKTDKGLKSFDKRKENIKNSFIDSIKEHSISDVEVGVCLSGGLDSSSIVYTLNKIYESKKKIKTFSLTCKGEKMDESYFIDIVNKDINSKPLTVSPGSNDLLEDIEEFVYYQEEPVISTSMYAHYKVMELVNKNNIKVTLDGQGGDEVFGGYNTFYAYYIYEYFIKFQYIKLFKFIYGMKKYYSKSIFSSILFPLGYLGYLLLPNKIKKIYREKNRIYLKQDFLVKNRKNYENNKKISFINKWFYLQQLEIIQNLLRYVDKNSMKWGIESRIPFLDYKLMEEVAKIPNEEKVKNGLTKYMLRESIGGIMNKEIKNRYDKKGFETPENKLLKSQKMKNYLYNQILTSESKIGDYINIDKFKIKYEKYISGGHISSTEIWKVINFGIWLKKYF